MEDDWSGDQTNTVNGTLHERATRSEDAIEQFSASYMMLGRIANMGYQRVKFRECARSLYQKDHVHSADPTAAEENKIRKADVRT